MWPIAIHLEWQQIKRLYLVRADSSWKGNLRLFKDHRLQTMFDQLMINGITDLDLVAYRNVLTHSFH